jgi:hypothetical protein
MATFAQMQDRINLDYLNRTDLAAETKRAIQRAIKHYEKERFWFNMTATALTVSTASNGVAVPADFIMLDFVTVTNNLQSELVTIRSFDRVSYNNRTGASGVPSEICYWQDKLVFSPKATSAHSITVHYTHTLPALSADADVNAWTSAGEDLIIHHATADMLANVLRVADPAQVQAHKTWEMEAYKMLKFGNDLRLRMNEDAGMTGAQHGTTPKLPDVNQP